LILLLTTAPDAVVGYPPKSPLSKGDFENREQREGDFENREQREGDFENREQREGDFENRERGTLRIERGGL